MQFEQQTPDLSSRGRRLPEILIVLLVFSTFTPYLGIALSIRYEQVIVFPILGLLLLSTLGGRPLRLTQVAAAVLLSWLILGLLVFLSTSALAATGTATVEPLAIIDSFVLPAGVFLIAFSAARSPGVDPKRLLRVAAVSILILLSLNSLFIQFFDPTDVGVRDFLRTFWSNPSSVTAVRRPVAEQALELDRYGGIFNQPFDGGVAYTIGLAVWLYLFVGGRRNGPVAWLLGSLSLALVLSGGVSAQSKVFVYGGLFVLAIAVVAGGVASIGRFARIVRVLAGIAIAFLVVGSLGLVESFDRSLDFLTAFREDPEERFSGIYGVTGGRTESVGDYFERLTGAVSLIGRGWSGPLDDAFLAYMRGAGLLGLLLFAALTVAMFKIVRGQVAESSERILGYCLVPFILVASFGALPLQSNRSSSWFWLLLGLLAANASSGFRRTNTDRRPVGFESGRVVQPELMPTRF